MNTQAFLGIDVSKGYADFLLLRADKTPIEDAFQLDDTRDGHRLLEDLLERFFNSFGITMISCGVESTGGYENNWYACLHSLARQMPVRISRINPKAIKAHRDGNLRRNVTDAESARAIAEYLIDHAQKVDYAQGHATDYHAYRSFHRAILLQIKQQTQLQNHFKQLLYSVFPELLIYCRRSIPVWLLTLLCKYPTPQRIAAQSVKRLTRLRHVTEERARALLAKATTSVASRTNPGYEYLIRSLAEQLLEMDTRITAQKEHLIASCTGPEVDLLKTIPGIGAYTAVVVMIELEDIHRFPDVRHLASYFGMHPVLKGSGDKETCRLSKQGRPALRASLYMPAMAAVRSDDQCREFYHRLRAKGKHHDAAIVAVMHKLLRVIFGVLHHGIPYDAARDLANRTRRDKDEPPEQQKRNALRTKRRYQTLTHEAPITRKQHRVRDEYRESVHPKNNHERSDLEVRDQINDPTMPMAD